VDKKARICYNTDEPGVCRFRPLGRQRIYGGNDMQFKTGIGWKACYDEERDLYTAQRSWRGFYQLCEIDKETYDVLGTEAMGDKSADEWIGEGRHLFEADDDYYTMPYCTVYDEDYMKLAPWSDAWKRADKKIETSRELTDLAVEVFASEEKNREHRKKKEEGKDAK
jgi:hypothetical protein